MSDDLPVDLVPRHRQLLVATQVPVDAAGAQVGATEAVLQCHVLRDDTDAACARLEDLVAEEQVLHLVAEAAQLLHHVARLVDEAGGQVVLQTTDAVEVWVEATTCGALDEIQHVLAVAERHEHRGDGTELHAEVAQEERHVGDAAELEQDGVEPLDAEHADQDHALLTLYYLPNEEAYISISNQDRKVNEKGKFETKSTEIVEYYKITTAQAEELRALKFYTVEQVAGASDAQIIKIGMLAGMSPYSFRDKAKAFLDKAKGLADDAKRDEELNLLKQELAQKAEENAKIKAETEAKLATMQEQMTAILAAVGTKKTGRKPKAQVEE